MFRRSREEIIVSSIDNTSVLLNTTVFALFVIFSFAFASPIVSSNADTATQTVGPHTLSMASEESAEINITPTSEQAIYSAANDIIVSNTCSAGATITMNTSGANNSLMRAASDDLVKSIPVTTGTSLDNTSWGFSTNNGTTWGAVPASTDTAATIYNGTDATTGTTVPIMFGAKIDSTLPSGTYTNDVVYTMTPNSGCLYYTVTWDLDGGTAAEATYPTTLNWGEAVDLSALTPTKDGYTFSGWSNGSDTFTGSETNTDINGNENHSLTMTAEWRPICSAPVGTVYNYTYTGAAQTFTVPCDGNYKVELWGAQGSGNGGKGAYVSGKTSLQKNTNLYLYVGSQSLSSSGNRIIPGYNGGGAGTSYDDNGSYAGGGSSDIRTTSGVWNNANSLRSRIMVAAGGAGERARTSKCSGCVFIPGVGGGLSGGNAGGNKYSVYNQPYGATQVGGGYAENGGSVVGDVSQYNGSFGYARQTTTETCWGSGGGGGWYGGAYGCGAAGSGGSSYISGHTGSVAVTSISSSSPKSGCVTGTTDRSCSLTPYINAATDESYTFTDTIMIDGTGYFWTNVKGSLQQMPNPSGGNYASGAGHSSNGYARVTYLGE